MKHVTTLILPLIALAAFAGAPGDAVAQGKIVSISKPTVQSQKTPKYNVTGPKTKKWTQKSWIEIEVPFVVTKAPAGTNALDQISFRYYVLISTAKGKKMLTGTVDHVNVPAKEKTASVVYISPQTVQKLSGKNSVSSPSKMVSAYGVEVEYNGETVGFFESKGAKTPAKAFWKAPGAQGVDGMLLTKKETPFASLWFDYHAEVR